MSDFSSVPEDLRPLVQSLTAHLTAAERREVIKLISTALGWHEPILPLVLICLSAAKKGETAAQKIQDSMELLAEQHSEFIAAIEARNALISTENRSMEITLKTATDDVATRLVALAESTQESIEPIAQTQAQLIQMHKQISAIRTRQHGTPWQSYAIGALAGFAVALFLS